jgi:hypothetical protein
MDGNPIPIAWPPHKKKLTKLCTLPFRVFSWPPSREAPDNEMEVLEDEPAPNDLS